MSKIKQHSDNTKEQYKTCGNRFAETTRTCNRRWRLDGRLPPKKLLTDENIRRFFARQWTYNYNKKTTQTAKTYISWALKENRLPPFIKEHEEKYKDSWAYLKNLKKDKRWSEYQPNAAESLTEKEVKKIAQSKIRDKRGRVVNELLRDKVAAFSLIHMGFHPEDCVRANWTKCKRVTHDDISGIRKQAIEIKGKATKRPGQKVRNHWACGCERHHNPENDMCELALVDKLVESLGEERANKSLFWNTNKGGYGWSDKQGPQKNGKISKSLQRINEREGIRPGAKLTGNMGRKTFVTLGSNFFLFPEPELKDKTHHKTTENLVAYLDPNYVNHGRATVVARVFQAYEQGRYIPPMTGNQTMILADIMHQMRGLKEVVSGVARTVGAVIQPNLIE